MMATGDEYMETRVAVVEADVKNLGNRFGDFLDDMRALRGTWTMVTITIVGFLFVIMGVMAGGFYWISETQTSVMVSQAETKKDIQSIKDSLSTINTSIEGIRKERISLQIEE